MAKVLVTGADQHQGLAVVRGLGMAGVSVVAASPTENPALGQVSRYAAARANYTPPQESIQGFIRDVLAIAERHGVSLIMPVTESTVVALDRHREEVEKRCPLASPDSHALSQAVDKMETFLLACKTGVPVPKTFHTGALGEALEHTRDFRFPLVLKPRGNPLHTNTRHRLAFKVQYARSRRELESALLHFNRKGALPLIQEFIPGTGVNVTVLFNRGEPVTMVAYEKVREVPLTGGVSVLRRTVALPDTLRDYITRLLREIGWHGVAMVEFKYDAGSGRFVLMEINGRFCASTALLVDAGVNLPHLAYQLHASVPLSAPAEYRVGVAERWLQGDFIALAQHLRGITAREATRDARQRLPSRSRAVWDFVASFRPGVHYDEFKWNDPRPGLYELASWSDEPARLARSAVRKVLGATPVARR